MSRFAIALAPAVYLVVAGPVVATEKRFFYADSVHIYRPNLDGSEREVVVTVPDPPAGLRDFTIDVPTRKLYWVVKDQLDWWLWRADLDGTNQEQLAELQVTIEPQGLMLLPPDAGRVPAIGNVGLVILVVVLLGAGAFVLA